MIEIRNKTISFLLCFSLLLLVLACKTQKENIKPKNRVETERKEEKKELNSDELLVSKIHNYSARFKTYSTKLFIEYDGMRFSGNLRINKDSIVWISIGKFGFEGVRMKMTRDSVFVINKLSNEYFVGNYDIFQKLLGFKLSLDIVQSLLLGEDFKDYDIDKFNLLYHENNTSINFKNRKNIRDSIYFPQINQEIVYNKSLNYIDRNTFELSLSPKNRIEVNYKSYQTLKDINLPKSVSIIIYRGKIIKAIMDMEKQRIDEELEFPFSIPKGYEPMF